MVSHGDDASRSTGPGYVVEVKRIYNCFDAWVALKVDLYALEDDKWVLIDDREFDVRLSRSVGCARADRLARRWMADYNAIRF